MDTCHAQQHADAVSETINYSPHDLAFEMTTSATCTLDAEPSEKRRKSSVESPSRCPDQTAAKLPSVPLRRQDGAGLAQQALRRGREQGPG